MDDADRAQEQIEREDEARLKRAHLAGYDALATGACLNCDHPLSPGIRFCGPECRDDWAQRVAAVLRNRAECLDD